MRCLSVCILTILAVTADAAKSCCWSGKYFNLESLSCVDLEVSLIKNVTETSVEDFDSNSQSGIYLSENVSEEFANEYQDEPVSDYYHCASNTFINVTPLKNDEPIPEGACEAKVDTTTYWTKCRMKAKSCCPGNMTYDLTNDKCVRSKNVTSPFVAVTFHDYEQIYFNYSYGDFQLTVSKPECLLPLLHFPGTNLLFDISNQYLILQDVNTTTKIAWEHDSYCLALDDTGSLIARMCHKDPCVGNQMGTSCAKSCCQPGHAINGMTLLCEPIEKVVPLDVPVRVKNGVTKSRITEVFRSVPLCQLAGLQTISIPMEHNKTDWWLTEEGTLYIEVMGEAKSDYCIGIEMGENGSMLLAVTCQSPKTPGNSVHFVVTLVSSSFLLAIILVHLLLKDLLNNHGISLICEAFSLFVVLVSNAVFRTNYNFDCQHFVLTMQFFLLATFSWLSTMSIDGGLLFRGRRSSRDKRLLAVYSIFAWGIPAILTAAASLLNTMTCIIETREYCWFTSDYTWYFIHGPIIAFLALSAIILMYSSLKLIESSRKPSVLANKDKYRAKDRLWAFLKLFLLTGLLWILDMVSWIMELEGTIGHIVFVITLLIPVLIFLIVVVNRRAGYFETVSIPMKHNKTDRDCWLTEEGTLYIEGMGEAKSDYCVGIEMGDNGSMTVGRLEALCTFWTAVV